MKWPSPTALLVVVSCLLAASGDAGEALEVEMEGGWVRLIPGRTTAAYGTFVNRSGRPIEVVRVECAVAGSVELHEVLTAQGPEGSDVKTMRRVEVLKIPAEGRVELRPGGHHLMLMDLHRPLKRGEGVALTLHRRDGRTVRLLLPVERR